MTRTAERTKISPSDIAAIKAPDILHAYCAAQLGQPQRVGSVLKYPCPFGAHTRPKLEVSEVKGQGLAICRACNRGGSVIDIAAAVLGADPHTAEGLAVIMRDISEVTGYRLTPTEPQGRRKRRGIAERVASAEPYRLGRPTTCANLIPAAAQRIAAAAAQASQAQPAGLPAELVAAARQAVQRLRHSPAAAVRHAATLGLPAAALDDAIMRGLLGQDESGRLCYLYHSGGTLAAVKVRHPKGHEPRFTCWKGSHKSLLWGCDSITPDSLIVMTEGESDAIAAGYSVQCLADALRSDGLTLPPVAVVARPDAGSVRPEWGAIIARHAVVLCVDADDAGRAGAARFVSELRAAGVTTVHIWTPPPPHKDARDAFRRDTPADLAESILAVAAYDREEVAR